MIVALSDTHADGRPSLPDHLREQIATADVVVHAGDFTTPATLDAFDRLADRLVAVHGNADLTVLRQRLPATATVEALGRTVLVAHGHEHDRTTLPLLARQEGADVVVTGHTHRPGVGEFGGVWVLNPGSHADPRGARPAYAAIGQTGNGAVEARLWTPTGDPIERWEL